MKKLLILLLTVAAFSSAQAQEPVVTYRVIEATDTTPVYVENMTTRVFPGGEIVFEGVRRPVVKDSLKSYLVRLEKIEDAAVVDIEKAKAARAETREEIKRIKKELEGKGGGRRTVMKEPQVLDIPSAESGLTPGYYLFDGMTFTRQADVKKVPTPKKKKKG